MDKASILQISRDCSERLKEMIVWFLITLMGIQLHWSSKMKATISLSEMQKEL